MVPENIEFMWWAYCGTPRAGDFLFPLTLVDHGL
jgi:hypothetical protein